MAEPIRNDEPMTTADIAGRRDDHASNPDVTAEAENQDPRRPQLVEKDFALEDIRNESVNNTAETRREWDTNRPTLDATNSNPTETTGPLFQDAEINDFRS